MAEIRLYYADCAGVPGNCSYPHEAVIEDIFIIYHYPFFFFSNRINFCDDCLFIETDIQLPFTILCVSSNGARIQNS